MSILEPITLTGTHVRLEPLSLAHVEPLVAAATSGPRDSYAFTRAPATLTEAVAYVNEALALHEAGHGLPFATVDARSGQIVGSPASEPAPRRASPTRRWKAATARLRARSGRASRLSASAIVA
jgi:hypothetical protein